MRWLIACAIIVAPLFALFIAAVIGMFGAF